MTPSEVQKAVKTMLDEDEAKEVVASPADTGKLKAQLQHLASLTGNEAWKHLTALINQRIEGATLQLNNASDLINVGRLQGELKVLREMRDWPVATASSIKEILREAE